MPIFDFTTNRVFDDRFSAFAPQGPQLKPGSSMFEPVPLDTGVRVRENGDVDFEALERLLDRGAAGGADYLGVLGTTAETPTLSAAERMTPVYGAQRLTMTHNFAVRKPLNLR